MRDPTEKHVMMANQIARNLAVRGEHAAAEMAGHIKRFWEPRMRDIMQAHLKAGGAGLDALAIDAFKVLWPEISVSKSAPKAAGAAPAKKASSRAR